MFGLLGGLLGGGMRGGLMRGGLMGRRGGGGGSQMPTYAGRAPQAEPMAPEPQEPSGQTQAPRQQEPPPQQPPEQPMAQQASQEVAKAQPEQQQQQKSPISGLLDEAKPQPTPQPSATDKPPEPPSIVNRTPTLTPVAKQADETLGQIPQLQKTDLITNQLFDSGTNRQRMEFQSGIPDKHFDTSDSEWTPSMGLSYKQPTTVAGSVPARKYRM